MPDLTRPFKKTDFARLKKIGLLIIILSFILDRVAKWAIVSYMVPGESLVIIPGFFELTFTLNTGIAFSFLNTSPFIIILLIVVVLLGYLIYAFIKTRNPLVCLGLSLMIGGTIGNLTDRLIYGGVVDFFHFYLFGASMPIFNTADTFICLGILLWIIGEYYD